MTQFKTAAKFRAALIEMTHPQLTAVGVLALERALRPYYLFLANSGLPDIGRLRMLSSDLWLHIENDQHSISNVISEDIYYDTDISDSEFVSAANDALDLASHVVAYINHGEIDSIFSALQCRLDSIDLFLQGNGSLGNSGSVEMAIEESEMMKAETSEIQKDIVALSGCEPERLFSVFLKRVFGAEIALPA